MPGPLSAIDRRRVLTGAGVLALLALAAPACSSAPTTPAIDDLEAQRQLALGDSELATAACADLSDPDAKDLAAALDPGAPERSHHARALAAEIARAAGRPPAEDTETSTPVAAPDTPAPTVTQVINALRAAADSAGKLAVASSGYRAGLLASIAASCTASYAVALAAPS
ncbi:hypothetical protein [Mycolicibacter arupensis]|uniref:hypothetical protein n=1 Tax=Mycolicibacter arupensis TaxID=342002 RepID=UPI003B3B2C29